MTSITSIHLSMPINIKDPEADRLIRQLAKASGESLTDAVTVAVRERLQRIARRRSSSLANELDEIAKRCAALPVLDGARRMRSWSTTSTACPADGHRPLGPP